MLQAALCFAVVMVGQPEANTAETAKSAEAKSSQWQRYYFEEARKYSVKATDRGKPMELRERAVLDWSSINDFQGAVFAWADQGRPALLGCIFSFPVEGSNQRLVVHEFASFAESEMTVMRPGVKQWTAPGAEKLQRVPQAATPPNQSNLIKLHGRRLAKDFTAHLNRLGERWELRLLPAPILEYQQVGNEILGGALFAFVGYSTDPEILLLLEARQAGDGPAWFFQAVRFSDKSLYLSFQDKPIWESLRSAHGSPGADTKDPQYRSLHSERISAKTIENLAVP